MVDKKNRRLPRQLPENRQQENFTHLMLTGSNRPESQLIASAGENAPLFWQGHPDAGSGPMYLNAISTLSETTTYSDTMSKYQSDSAYSKSGGISLDGLFVPFSTNFVVKSDEGSVSDKNKPAGNLPSYERPYSKYTRAGVVVDDVDVTEGATHPMLGTAAPSPEYVTSVSLNPYASGHQITHVNKGTQLDGNDGRIGSQNAYEKYPRDVPTLVSAPELSQEVQRPMALRGPLVIAGWGYDTEGLPVPNMKYDADYKEGDPNSTSFGKQKYVPRQMKAIDDQGTEQDHKHFIPNHLSRPDKWKVGPVDLRWDRERKVWTGGGGEKAAPPVNLFLCKAAKCILPQAGMDGNNSFNFGVGGNINSPGRLYRNPCPTIDCNYNSYFPTSIYYEDIQIYDPEDHNWCGLCKTFGNVTACGDFADACKPFYDGIIIRKLSEKVGGTESLKECTDKFRKAEGGNPHARRAGNPCHGWGSSYFGKTETVSSKITSKDWTGSAKDILYERIFIDNPLGQGLMVGDTFFSYDTGRRITHEYVRSETPGCGSQGGKKITVKETIAVHAILQGEFYGMEIISHAGCDRGEMAACSRKFFAQGFATGEDCGPDDDYTVTSTAYSS